MSAAAINSTPTRWQKLAQGLFWGWNFVFVAFMLLGFAPRLLPDLLQNIRSGAIDARFLVYAVTLSLTPIAAIALGFFFLRRHPERLFALGYVVEGPVMLLLAVRFFVVRQGSPALSFLLAVAGLGMAAFLWDLLDQHGDQRRSGVLRVRLLGLTVMLIVALYAAVWIAFYALPGVFLIAEFVVNLVSNFSSMLISDSPVWIPFSVLGMILVLFTSILFVLAPVAVPLLSFTAFRRSFRLLAGRGEALHAAAAVATLATAAAVLFVLVNRQPQQRAFALLENPPETPEAARALLEQEQVLRAGLLNAYLAPFRYITSEGEVGHIAELYQGLVGFSGEAAQRVERLYEFVAQPLLYRPVHPTSEQYDASNNRIFAMQREPAEAARLYQRVFDTPIVEGERDVILDAARSTWDGQRAEAALQVLDEREVHLAQQEISIIEHGDWAEIELHEVYRNTTTTRQEVIYYFSLPETAALTGVWLGGSANRNSRFEYIVAPRGAAQAVYRNEVRRNIDPALLEQIGPRQYRLRIFPIEPIQMTYNDAADLWIRGDAPEMHLWLTWKALAGEDGWPVPHLTLKRNIFFDDDTLRTLNGQALDVVLDENEATSGWLPKTLPVTAPIVPQTHRADLPGGITVIAEPLSQVQLPALPKGLRLAVVIDRSFSMAAHKAAMAQAIERLRDLTETQIGAYLTASRFSGEQPQRIAFEAMDINQIEFLGGQNPAELLAQFSSLSVGQDYDAVLVLTDTSGYELGQSPAAFAVPSAPVWFVHLDNETPLGYDDATLTAILSSRGGVAANLEEALQRIAVGQERSGDADSTVHRDLVDEYLWTVLPSDAVTGQSAPASDPGFAALAARRAMLAEMSRSANNLNDPATLDRLHAWAQEFSIVSPYSSMIVLVDEQQEELLRRLSQADDRFQREVEDLGDTTPATQVPLAGVPEPEEWLLIAAAVLVLGYALMTRRRAPQRRSVL